MDDMDDMDDIAMLAGTVPAWVRHRPKKIRQQSLKTCATRQTPKLSLRTDLGPQFLSTRYSLRETVFGQSWKRGTLLLYALILLYLGCIFVALSRLHNSSSMNEKGFF